MHRNSERFSELSALVSEKNAWMCRGSRHPKAVYVVIKVREMSMQNGLGDAI